MAVKERIILHTTCGPAAGVSVKMCQFLGKEQLTKIFLPPGT